jgi:4-hydroxyphenylpyruvate dioxygenase
MPDLFDNPAGLDGFEFVEFCAPEKGVLEPVFAAMGFAHVATHRSKDVHLWRQGQINLIANYEPRSAAWYFAREHGPSACGMAFRVRDAHAAWAHLIERGAEPVAVQTGPMELHLPAIRGIGGAILYLIDRYEDEAGEGLTIYDFWADYYEHLFNFREIRFFDIKGEYTGLTSKALTAPDGKVRIPLNEEGEGGKGQIEEFLRAFNGEGIQHIALICDDLLAACDRLRAAGVPLMAAPPPAYYAMLDQRLPGHGEDAGALEARGILLDGTTDGGPRLLLQIFAQAQIGPVFFEFIQRKGDDGFGEGNFKALFESLERDQIERGVLEVKP